MSVTESSRDIGELIEAELPSLRRYARHFNWVEADDLVQDTVTRALSKLHLFEPGTNMQAWLKTMMYNISVDHVRLSSKSGVLPAPGQEIGATCRQEPTLMLRDLNRALKKLSPIQRAIVGVVGIEGATYSEAAVILKIPQGSVQSGLSRARTLLRNLIFDKHPDDKSPCL